MNKTIILNIAAASFLALTASNAIAVTLNDQLTAAQVDAACAGQAAGSVLNVSATISGATVTGTIDCAAPSTTGGTTATVSGTGTGSNHDANDDNDDDDDGEDHDSNDHDGEGSDD